DAYKEGGDSSDYKPLDIIFEEKITDIARKLASNCKPPEITFSSEFPGICTVDQQISTIGKVKSDRPLAWVTGPAGTVEFNEEQELFEYSLPIQVSTTYGGSTA